MTSFQSIETTLTSAEKSYLVCIAHANLAGVPFMQQAADRGTRVWVVANKLLRLGYLDEVSKTKRSMRALIINETGAEYLKGLTDG